MTSSQQTHQLATFAGGCFWCIEAAFIGLDGVTKIRSGFTGGDKPIDYDQLHSNPAGHREAVEVTFDPHIISYQRLLEIFWLNIDPTDPEGQFIDRGFEYTTAIYYHSPAQQQAAEYSKQKLGESGKFSNSIVTEILPATKFYQAKGLAAQFVQKYPDRYAAYRQGSGRSQFLESTWGSSHPEHMD